MWRGPVTLEKDTYLQHFVLRLDGNDLVPNKLQDAIHHWLKALENFLVGKCHVPFFDPSIWELCFDTNIDRPFLAIVSEIRLDPVFKVHYTFRVHSTGRLRSIGQLHFANLGTQDVAEVTVQGGRTTRIPGSSCAFGDREWSLFLNLVGDQIDRSTTAVHNEDSIPYLEVQQTGF